MKKIIYFATAAVLALSSCGDKEENSSDAPEQPSGQGDVTEKLDNASAQKKLESYATEFINKFKPADQEAAIKALTDLSNLFDKLDSPDRWSKDDDKKVSKKFFVAQYAANLANSLSKRDYSKSTEINEEFVFDFSDYSGIYEEGAEDWTYTESNDIVFKFKTEDGTACEFKAVRANSDIAEQFKDGDETYKISAPAGVTITLNYGGAEVIRTEANVKYDSRKSLEANVSCTVANLKVTSVTKITNNEISDNQSVAIDGTTLLWTEVAAKGNHFTDVSHFEEKVAESEEEEEEEEEGDEEDFNPQDYVTSVNGKVNIMGNIQVSYDIKLDSYFDNFEAFNYDDESEQSVKEYCDAWNKTYNIKFFYSGTDVQQGTFKMQHKLLDSWSYGTGRTYEEWGIQPVIVFEADGTSFAFEDYFNEDKFADTNNQLETLWDKYEAYWD